MNLLSFFKSTAILLLLLAGSAHLCYAQTQADVLPVPVGKVVWVNGNFHAKMPNKEDRKLEKASVIFLHDTLITDKNAQAQIVFSDNTMMTFKPETTFIIQQYEFKPQAKGESVGKYVMNLLEGGFRTITGLIAKKNPTDYQVNTPVATIGVRGTDYAVYFNKGELYIGYYEGKPCVRGGIKKEELCLDKDKPYGYVDSKSVAPVPMTQQPAVFQEKMTIISAVAPVFSSTGLPPGGGVINNSFCITN
jgi:hypothetical protein